MTNSDWRERAKGAQEHIERLTSAKYRRLKLLLDSGGMSIPARRVAKNGAVSIVIVEIPTPRIHAAEAIKKTILDGVIDINDLPDIQELKDIYEPVKTVSDDVVSRLRAMREKLKIRMEGNMQPYLDCAYKVRRQIYDDYLQSEAWQDKRAQCIAHHGDKCIKCGDFPVDIHHLTYERLGDELMEDIIPLCRECHAGAHS